MTLVKGRSIKVFCWAFCAVLLFSCHSSNNVVSSYGKRKYTKGWFLFRHGKVDSKSAEGKDTSLTHNYNVANHRKTENPVSVTTPPGQQEQTPHQKRRARRDSLRRIARINAAASAATDKTKAKGPPEPPDDIYLKLLVLIIVLTGLSILFTGLITPITVWGITQNFMLGVGVILTFVAYLISVNTTLGVTLILSQRQALQFRQTRVDIVSLGYHSLNAALPGGKNPSLNKSGHAGGYHCWHVLWGECVLLSLLLAIKALFVKDRHPGKAVLALFVDMLLIAAVVALLV